MRNHLPPAPFNDLCTGNPAAPRVRPQQTRATAGLIRVDNELHKSRPARSELPYVIPQCLPSKTPARRPQRGPTLRPKHRKSRPDVIRRVHAADNDPQHLLNQYLRCQHLRNMLRASHVTVWAKKKSTSSSCPKCANLLPRTSVTCSDACSPATWSSASPARPQTGDDGAREC